MRKLPLLLAFGSSIVFAAAPKLVITSQYTDGRDRVVQVRNDAEATITAFMVGGAEKAATMDILLGAHEGRLLKTGDTAEVKIKNGGDVEAQVLAIVFENGATEGEPSLVLGNRQEVAEQVRFALALLHNQNVHNFPASAVANWFRQWRQRWQASDPNKAMPVADAAETYLKQAGNEIATRPARELTEAFEELFTKLTGAQPAL